MRTIKDGKFVNFTAALLAMQAAHMLLAEQGFLVSTHTLKETGSIELTAHIDLPRWPKLPDCYKYSSREISSFTSYNRWTQQPTRVRTICYEFNF